MKGLFIAGLEAKFSKKEKEWILERKQLQKQLEDVKAQLITQLETRDVEQNQQLAALETQNQQLVNQNRAHKDEILKLEAKITKLTDQLEEQATLLEGQNRALSGLLKQHFFGFLLFLLVPLISRTPSVEIGFSAKPVLNRC